MEGPITLTDEQGHSICVESEILREILSKALAGFGLRKRRSVPERQKLLEELGTSAYKLIRYIDLPDEHPIADADSQDGMEAE